MAISISATKVASPVPHSATGRPHGQHKTWLLTTEQGRVTLTPADARVASGRERSRAGQRREAVSEPGASHAQTCSNLSLVDVHVKFPLEVHKDNHTHPIQLAQHLDQRGTTYGAQISQSFPAK